jgi:hypothetical protein
MDKLYAKLSEQHSIMQQQQKEAQKSLDDDAVYTSSCSSLPVTPATEVFPPTAPTTRSASATPDESGVTTEEVLRLKLELAQAQTKISRLDQELAQTRFVNHESGRTTPAPVAEPDFLPAMVPIASPATSRLSSALALNIPGKPPFIRENSWMTQDDTRSDISDSLSAGGFNRTRGIWNSNKPAFPNPFPQDQMMGDAPQPVPWPNSRAINPSYEHPFAASGIDMYRQDRMVPDQDVMRPMGRRANRYDNRYGASNNFGGGFSGGYNMGGGHYEPTPSYAPGAQGSMAGGIGMGMYAPYQQQPVGTPLSPHATEFTSTGAPWKTEVSEKIC